MTIAAAVLYAAFVVYQSLADGGSWQCGGPALALSVRVSRTDLLANVVAYAPLGLLAARLAKARRSWAIACGIAGPSALSLAMEFAQSCQPARVSSAYDWMANSTGAAIGVVTAFALDAALTAMRVRRTSPDDPARRLRLLTLGVVVGWIVSQTAPWVFAVDVGTVRGNLSFLRRWSPAAPLDGWHLLRHAGAWGALASAWRLLLPDGRRAAAALGLAAGLSLALQLLLDARAPLSVEELVGMTAALLIALPLVLLGGAAPDRGRWAFALLVTAGVVVVAYELRPDPAATAPAAFSWWPRVGLGGLRGALDYALLFGWFGLATAVATRWIGDAGHPTAARWIPWAAVATLLLLEFTQTTIPGRGPDVSAPVFSALAVLIAQVLLGPVRR